MTRIRAGRNCIISYLRVGEGDIVPRSAHRGDNMWIDREMQTLDLSARHFFLKILLVEGTTTYRKTVSKPALLVTP